MNKQNASYRYTIPIAGILILLLSLALSLPVRAAEGAGRISGQVLDGSNKNAPLAGQQVTLQRAQGENAQNLATTTTDAQGNFVFEGLATDKANTYVVYMRYQNAHYMSALLTLEANPAPRVDLTVYQATTSSEKILIGRVTTLAREPNIHTKTIPISEIYSITNLDTHAYVGSLDASNGKPNALRFSLPEGARNISLGKGFSGYDVIQVDRGFATDAAVLPGDNEFSFSYEVPYNERTLDLRYKTLYPTLSYSFMVPTDLLFTSSTFQSADVVNSGNDQRPYSLFKAEQLPANQEFQVQLDGLYLPEDDSGRLSPTIIWLLVLIGLMVAIMIVTWFMLRATRRKPATASKKVRKNTKPVSTTKKAREKQAVDQEQELLQELLELDQDHEAGKIEKAAYQEQRSKLKAKLRTLMREQGALRG